MLDLFQLNLKYWLKVMSYLLRLLSLIVIIYAVKVSIISIVQYKTCKCQIRYKMTVTDTFYIF